MVSSAVRAAANETPQTLECFSVAQTRQKIAEHRLVDPFPLMQSASSANQGEALSTRLCRRGEVFLYEINVLRRDGRVMKIFVDAASGRPHAGRQEPARPEAGRAEPGRPERGQLEH
ncbi:MAG: hypothetical protein WAK03_15960 [Methylocystis sp.]|jgi:hypothetical protein